MRRGAHRYTLASAIAVACAMSGCGSRSSLPLSFWTDDGSSDGSFDSSLDFGFETGGHTGLDLVGGTGGTDGFGASGGTASTGGVPSTGGAPSVAGAAGAGAEVELELTYFKAFPPGSVDYFGFAVALSADGSTLAVGAPSEDGASTGINGDPTDLGAGASGAVYIYRRMGGEWVARDYIKASNTDNTDSFGSALALSADGAFLVVGAPGEDSSASGTNGNDDDDSVTNSGAAYLFEYAAGSWVQKGYLKASNPDVFDLFGTSVAISSSGDTIAVGAPGEASMATGTYTGSYGDQADDSAPDAGAVYVYEWNGYQWLETDYVKASNTDEGDRFGLSVALSGPGSMLAVGAPGESSGATGTDGNQSDDSMSNAGAAYVFMREGPWVQHAYVKASNTGDGDQFGASVSLSAVGDTLAVGATTEKSLSSGIDGNQSDDTGTAVGAAYLFSLGQPTWTQVAYVKASNPEAAHFGRALALAGDGQSLIVGAREEQGASTGVNGDQSTPVLVGAGAAYLFRQDPAGWAQAAYLKASNTGGGDYFGAAVAVDFDGRTMAVGAIHEASSGSGVDGDSGSNDLTSAGAAYVYSSE